MQRIARAIEILYEKYIEKETNITRPNFKGHGFDHNLSDSEVIDQAINAKGGKIFYELLKRKLSMKSEPSQQLTTIYTSNKEMAQIYLLI